MTHFCAIVGTGGTFVGAARALKARNTAVQCYAVEPEGAQPLAGKPISDPRHKLQGAGYASVPPLWDARVSDGTLAISDDEATETARLLAMREGIFAGFSSGANVAAALRLARTAARRQPDRYCCLRYRPQISFHRSRSVTVRHGNAKIGKSPYE